MKTQTKSQTKSQTTQDVISEVNLLAIETMREKKKSLLRQLGDIETDLELAESVILSRLTNGAVCQGPHEAFIDYKMGSCRPAYKDLYVTLATEKGLSPDEAIQSAQELYPPTEKQVLVIVKEA